MMINATQDNLIPTQIIGRDIVFFDGSCALCHGLVRKVLQNDIENHFLLCAQQSEMGYLLLNRHNIDVESLKTIYVIKDCGTDNELIFSRSKAVIYVMKRMPKYRWLAALLGPLPSPMVDFGYNIVAAVRYRIFGKTETCLMPSPEERARVIG